MLQYERLEKIMDLLKKNHKILIHDTAKLFNVSDETIRRDLKILETREQITKIHGGAILSSNNVHEIFYQDRLKINAAQKEKIAKLLISVIPDNATIMSDSSSTVYLSFKSLLKEKSFRTVITNSIHLLQLLSDQDVAVIATGGKIKSKSYSMIGDIAISTLSQYKVDFFITSCKGISLDFGVSESNDEEASIKKKMASQAKNTILVVDDSKFDYESFSKVFSIKQINTIITNKKPSHKWQKFCEENSINLVF